MSADGTGPGVEPRKTRESIATDVSEPGLLARLGDARWFRPLILAVPVVVSAIVLAPRWARRSYPTDAELEGTPAPEKIKAPYDIEIVDEEATAAIRDAAEERVPPVYDFDAELGAESAKRVGAAFRAMAERRASFLDDHPEYERLSRSSRARLDEELSVALEEIRPEFERLLGEPLTPEEHSLLTERQFDADLGRALSQVLVTIQAEPLVGSTRELASGTERGITVQRVPDDGSPNRLVDDISTVATVSSAHQRLPEQLAATLPEMPPAERLVLAELASRMLAPNLTPNRAATEVAREVARLSVGPETKAYKQGETVIQDGEIITSRHLMLFRELSRSSGGTSTLLVALGGGILVLILLLAGFGAGRGRGWSLALEPRDLLFLTALFSLAIIGARIWLGFASYVEEVFTSIPNETFVFIIPVAAGAMITRMVLRREVAILFAVVGSVVLGLMVETQVGLLAYVMVGSVLGATMVRGMSRRSDLLRAGLWVAGGQATVAIALQLFDANTALDAYLITATAAGVSGILAAFIALGLTLVVESVFGYTTDLQLLELANLNHPALKELIVQAPGSYHHSIIVGSLVEAAAEEINANALLARVMAYYHDIGKGQNPGYFSENQRGQANPHNKLKPSMSATVIRRHVADGLELARRYRLGEPIRAAIGEHHGTTLIQFFYQKAKENEDENNPVSEQDYRYAGRKPRSRETALVMLGDSVEAACRSLADPTPARVKGVVNRVTNLKFTDGQLEQCDLTLKDLHAIAKAFTRVLNSIYHDRPEYPGVTADMTGKKPNGDLDPKPAKATRRPDEDGEEDRPDNIRRLGIDGR